MMVISKKNFAALVISAVALATAPALSADINTIAIVTPEAGTDFGWNQQGVDGVRAAAEAAGIEVVVAENLGYGNIRPTLRELAEDGVDLIVAHAAGYASDAAEIARETGTHVAASITSEAPLIGNYLLSGERAAFLAGVLAAKTTKTKSIGIVVSGESPIWNAQSAGFVQGVRYADPDVTVRYAIIGPAAYADVAGARRVTESVIAAGADIIFGQGNGASFGMLQAIETAAPADGGKVWFIDVIGDKTSIDKGHLLSSVLWDMEPIVSAMISDIKADTFGTGDYQLTLEDGSQRLLKSPYIEESLWAELEEVKAKIISGEVTVEVVTDSEETRRLMNTTEVNQ